MNKFYALLRVAFPSVAVLYCCIGCAVSDTVTPDQQENIQRYLVSNQLDYIIQDGVYKHTAGRGGVDESTLIETGDSVFFYFEAQTFTSSPGAHFYTNKAWLIDSLVERTGLNPQYWSREIMNVKLGHTRLVEGLSRGLAGSYEGDSVLLLFPFHLGFGNVFMSTVPKKSALIYTVNIETVKKQ